MLEKKLQLHRVPKKRGQSILVITLANLDTVS